MSVLAIDLGGSHVSCAVVAGETVLAETTMLSEARSLADTLNDIAGSLRTGISESGIDPRGLRGIAVGYCGIVDGESGEVLSVLNKYADARQVDLTRWAREEFHLPLRLENDACLALLGEASAGVARDLKDVVMVTLGTGIGGAAMLGGKLLRSKAGQAGCLGGHLPVNFRGRLCKCGAVGCAETEASSWVLPELARGHPGFAGSLLAREAYLNFEVLFAAVDAGDTVARDLLNHCVEVWSSLTVGLIHAYGPEMVVFGGGVMRRSAEVLGPIREYVEEHMWRTSRGVPRIELAMLGSQAALLGGMVLFPDEEFQGQDD